jgi:hypothetical protein
MGSPSAPAPARTPGSVAIAAAVTSAVAALDINNVRDNDIKVLLHMLLHSMLHPSLESLELNSCLISYSICVWLTHPKSRAAGAG